MIKFLGLCETLACSSWFFLLRFSVEMFLKWIKRFSWFSLVFEICSSFEKCVELIAVIFLFHGFLPKLINDDYSFLFHSLFADYHNNASVSCHNEPAISTSDLSVLRSNFWNFVFFPGITEPTIDLQRWKFIFSIVFYNFGLATSLPI